MLNAYQIHGWMPQKIKANWNFILLLENFEVSQVLQ